jgi:major membrane immunogen (membrane-anchored lipoprotein)
MFILIFTLSLLSSSVFSSNTCSDKKEDNPAGIWKLVIQPEDEDKMNAKLNISQSQNDKSYSGFFRVLIKKAKMEDFTFDQKSKNLKFKADIGFVELTFDLFLREGKLEGKVNGSDGLKGIVTGERKE